jgi:hypothetical protein
MKKLLTAIAIISTLIGSACSTVPEVRYVTRPLTAPARPVLPRVSAEDMSCLTDQAYRKLVERERLRREYSEDLEAIIRSTQQAIPK